MTATSDRCHGLAPNYISQRRSDHSPDNSSPRHRPHTTIARLPGRNLLRLSNLSVPLSTLIPGTPPLINTAHCTLCPIHPRSARTNTLNTPSIPTHSASCQPHRQIPNHPSRASGFHHRPPLTYLPTRALSHHLTLSSHPDITHSSLRRYSPRGLCADWSMLQLGVDRTPSQGMVHDPDRAWVHAACSMRHAPSIMHHAAPWHQIWA
jgi:hypothetical protein